MIHIMIMIQIYIYSQHYDIIIVDHLLERVSKCLLLLY